VSAFNGRVYDVTTGGTYTTATANVVATGLSTPRNMLWTPTGILVVEQGTGRVTKLGNLGGNSGPSQTVASGIVDAADIEMFNGRIYVTSYSTNQVYDITSGGDMTEANVFAFGQSFIALASANGKLYASTIEDRPRIFDITAGNAITAAQVFGHSLPESGDTMFDAVPGSVQPPATSIPEPSTLTMLVGGILLVGFGQRHF
jgi:hypothetical protein